VHSPNRKLRIERDTTTCKIQVELGRFPTKGLRPNRRRPNRLHFQVDVSGLYLVVSLLIRNFFVIVTIPTLHRNNR
jgi:hypothetical protein